MNSFIDIKRRKFLQYAGIGTATMALAPNWLWAEASPKNNAYLFSNPDVEIGMTAQVTEIPILSGPPTEVWKFSAKLLNGPEGTVEEIPGSYLGPILRLRKGQKVRIHFHNNVPGPCVVHQHGLHVPEKSDGHPHYAIDSGQTYSYDFQVLNRAGTYWYHSHTHRVTGHRVYFGLAGLLLVSDEEERALNLPGGDYEIPLVIQDRQFGNRNELHYVHGMHDRMTGFLGDQILVNGFPDFELPVATRAYRLRILNGSNSRIYKLAWSDGTPMTVIASDGGLLEKPERYPYVTLAPAERVELWVDFSGRKVGSEIKLQSLPFSGATPRMGGGMGRGHGRGRHGHGSSALPNGAGFSIMKVRIVRKEEVNQKLPERLSTIRSHQIQEAENPDHPRTIRLSMRPHSPRLNGRSFRMTAVADEEVFKLNSLQLMEFVNRDRRARGMMMAHPMHIHGQPFQIVKREVLPGFQQDYATLSEGFISSGWRDTVLVMPGEKVTLLKPFEDYEGLFLYHCHNTEHEDLDMMRNFQVRA
ncbi:Bilirubin oxidase [Nitrosococcus halophilus Nc 4]|uniref:Bilirubin oxidase n=1 Tax=Nitrosococcus halophilus (strain Nc4) TaxID=472759 RepID=D5BVJ7_NITHN|nr:multicopper oxidase domain-containing protein [Nitrosococcus halophilus]ADE13625.1 Bilirubin oxidase [Nitrosococcus halophilus Nc 4]